MQVRLDVLDVGVQTAQHCRRRAPAPRLPFHVERERAFQHTNFHADFAQLLTQYPVVLFDPVVAQLVQFALIDLIDFELQLQQAKQVISAGEDRSMGGTDTVKRQAKDERRLRARCQRARLMA